MKTLLNFKIILVGLAMAFSTGCSSTRESATLNQAEQDLVELRNWMGSKFDQAAAATADERAALSREFNDLSARVERGVDNLADESREEYNQLRSRFNEWEEEQARAEKEKEQERQSQAALDPDREKKWTRQLLGESYENISELSADQLDEAYGVFMENIRNQRRDWSETEWEYAQGVLDQLKERKHAVSESIATSDRVKFETWEAEFGTLKTTKEVTEDIRN